MIRWLTLSEVLALHRSIIATTGAQPRAGFGGEDLYPDLPSKAAAMGFSLAMNHPFIDGNKRIAHAAMEIFLFLNGLEIEAGVDEQEQTVLALASGALDRNGLLDWLRAHLVELD